MYGEDYATSKDVYDGCSEKGCKMRRRTVINAKIPRPNDNVTMTMGNKALVQSLMYSIRSSGPSTYTKNVGLKSGRRIREHSCGDTTL